MRTLLFLFCAALTTSFGFAQDKQEKDLSWVDQRVADWQMKPSERKFDQIGWLTDIRAALDLAKKNNRPVFLFTHDGRMAIGRC
jgi:hypothetical protein